MSLGTVEDRGALSSVTSIKAAETEALAAGDKDLGELTGASPDPSP